MKENYKGGLVMEAIYVKEHLPSIVYMTSEIDSRIESDKKELLKLTAQLMQTINLSLETALKESLEFYNKNEIDKSILLDVVRSFQYFHKKGEKLFSTLKNEIETKILNASAYESLSITLNAYKRITDRKYVNKEIDIKRIERIMNWSREIVKSLERDINWENFRYSKVEFVNLTAHGISYSLVEDNLILNHSYSFA